MDNFGTGAGVAASVQIYLQSARRTGRTEALLDSLKNDDRVICFTDKEAKQLVARAKDRGIVITAIAFPISGDPMTLGTSQGRTLFDHRWLEQYYVGILERSINRIDYWQAQLSGHFGEKHIATRKQAEEMNRWQHALGGIDTGKIGGE